MEYMERDHVDAHLDYPPLVENEFGSAAHPIPAGSVQCPKCNGWGGWNLRLNAYKTTQPDTPENRHKYVHFRASCDQCVGWGHVPEADSHCVHEWGNATTIGRCLTDYTCKHCGTHRTVDSSD